MFMKRNPAGGWEKNSALMHSRSKEVPWYLASVGFDYSYPGTNVFICITINELIAKINL